MDDLGSEINIRRNDQSQKWEQQYFLLEL
jgi:hypothetical protein